MHKTLLLVFIHGFKVGVLVDSPTSTDFLDVLLSLNLDRILTYSAISLGQR
jgi:hypothetical protein